MPKFGTHEDPSGLPTSSCMYLYLYLYMYIKLDCGDMALVLWRELRVGKGRDKRTIGSAEYYAMAT